MKNLKTNFEKKNKTYLVFKNAAQIYSLVMFCMNQLRNCPVFKSVRRK